MTRLKTLGGSHTVQFGTTPIRFELLYSDRKTLAVRVYPDQSIQVDVPSGTPYEATEAFIRRRGAWIVHHLRELQGYERPQSYIPRQYVSGESYRYLGRQYRLKVVADPVERVILSRGYLTLGTPNPPDRQQVRTVLQRWYRARAEHVFATRLNACYPKVEFLGVPKPPIAVRPMKRRWGSCSPKGAITLNLKLIQAPIDLIDYVILHELCHLKELNHNPRFWALLARVLPTWEERRYRLNHYDFSEL